MLSIQKLKAKSVNRLSKAYNKYKTCLNTLTNNVGKVLHGDSLAFVNHQLRMASRPPKGRRYSLDMRLLSLSLYNSGPKAYKYLATIFCLPSKRSLTKWLENMKCTPGFHEETFVGLAERFKFLKDHEKTCCLLIDEINFKSHLQYDRHNDNVVGYEDLSVFGGRSPKLAKSALVFMLRGMSSNWTQPIGYVFSSGSCNAEVVQSMIFHCLDKCCEIGAEVKVVISDQGSNFQQLVKKLDVTINKPYFTHGLKNYFYMFDPPHLIKSIRNNLFKYDVHYNQNKIASWSVIRKFFDLDSKHQFRLCPKLTYNHINLPAFTKMKVKFATQIFSRSLAAALETYSRLLGVNALGTSDFLVKFNNLFDLINCSRLNTSNPYLCAMSNTSPHLEYFQNFKVWLRNVKFMSKNNVCMNNKIKCLTGWQLTLTVIEQLWPVLRDEHGFDFLLTRRLNSDPLENLFSVIRQKGGNCTNPTPYNFSAIIKQVTCQRLFHPVKGANCEMDITKILTVISSCSKNNIATTHINSCKNKKNV